LLAVTAMLYVSSAVAFYRFHIATSVTADGKAITYFSIRDTRMNRALMVIYEPLIKLALSKPPSKLWY
jgi:hypothetical protein